MPATIFITCAKCKAQLKGPSDLMGKKVKCKGCGHVFVVPVSPEIQAAAARTVPKKAAAERPPVSPNRKAAGPAPRPATAPKPAAPKPPSNEGPATYSFSTEEAALAAIEKAKSSMDLGPSVASSLPSHDVYDQANPPPYKLTDLSLKPRCPHCANELPSEDAIICLHCGYHLQNRSHLEVLRTFENTSEDMFKWRLPGIVCTIVSLLSLAIIIFLWLGLHPLAERNADAWWTWIDGLWFQVWVSIFFAFLGFFMGRFGYKRLIMEPHPPELEKN